LAREAIAKYSLPRAKKRISRAKEEATMTESARMARNQEVTRKIKATDILVGRMSHKKPQSNLSFWLLAKPENRRALLADQFLVN
jgi:hypothetical protein